MSPVDKLARKTATIRKPKYTPALAVIRVETASRAKMTMLIKREVAIRRGYEAFFCNFVRTSMEPRLATVETEISADWKCREIHLFDSKRW